MEKCTSELEVVDDKAYRLVLPRTPPSSLPQYSLGPRWRRGGRGRGRGRGTETSQDQHKTEPESQRKWGQQAQGRTRKERHCNPAREEEGQSGGRPACRSRERKRNIELFVIDFCYIHLDVYLQPKSCFSGISEQEGFDPCPFMLTILERDNDKFNGQIGTTLLPPRLRS